MLRTSRLLALTASATIALGMFAGGSAGASPWELPDLPEVDPCVFLPGGCEVPEPDPDPVPAFPIPDDLVPLDPCWFNPECGPLDPGDPGDDAPDDDGTPEDDGTPDPTVPSADPGDSPSTDSSVQTAAPAVVVNASPNFTG